MAADKWKRMEVALQQAKEAAEQVNQAKGVFLASLSHELRTPITSILAMVELLQLEALTEMQRASIAAIHQRVMQTVQPEADHKGLDLAVTIAPEVPVAIVGDLFRLRQVLLNLLSNAVKFTETGSVQVRVVREQHNWYSMSWIRGLGLALRRKPTYLLFFLYING